MFPKLEHRESQFQTQAKGLVCASNPGGLTAECPGTGVRKAPGERITRDCVGGQDSFGKYCLGPDMKIAEMGHGQQI